MRKVEFIKTTKQRPCGIAHSDGEGRKTLIAEEAVVLSFN